MAVDGPRPLFVYQLGVTYATELGSASMFELLARRVRDPGLAELFRQQEQSKRCQADNLAECVESVGRSPLQSTAPSEQGLRERFENFTQMQPSPEVLDMWALGVAIRSKHLAILNYQELAELAELLGESTCLERLRSNLQTKEANLARLEEQRAAARNRIFAVV
ncbi:MAG TPA: DUF892 family protein [Micromonosporaceae bacterium]